VNKKGNFYSFNSNEVEKFRLPNGERIMTLQKFCRLYLQRFTLIYLDIKGDNGDFKRKAENICRAIGKEKLNRLVLIGTPWRVIKTVKKYQPRVNIGFEQKGAIANFLLGADTVSLYHKYEFSYAEYKLAKFLKLDVVIWTVNDLKVLKEFANNYRLTILTDLTMKK